MPRLRVVMLTVAVSFGNACLVISPAHAWSVAGHRLVSDAAVGVAASRCPKLIRGRLRQLGFHAIEPDIILRPRNGRSEEIRHFIDLDAYGPLPFSSLPRGYDDAVRKWGRQTVRERGILPWAIGRMTGRLEREVKNGDWRRARVTAGRLGHYVADAYMPLHLTVNHDGQLSGQKGVHHRVEWLVNADLSHYRRSVTRRVKLRPIMVATVEKTIFTDMVESYRLVEHILTAERIIRRRSKLDSTQYAQALQEVLAPVITSQLVRASSTLASIWTAVCH